MPCFRADDRADVAIVGGGPAGASAALTLRRQAPGLEVVLLEAGLWDKVKPGEVLPAAALGLLDRLGVAKAVRQAGFVPARAIASAWASETPGERHAIFSAQGAGWHLDRTRFDRLMAEAAAGAGAGLRPGTSVRSAERAGERWRLHLAGGRTIEARSVIWATGRNWRLARSFGAAVRTHEDLAAYARYFDGVSGDGSTLIEARPEGWWYSADLPGRRRVIACMTEPDIARAMDLRSEEGWRRALAAVPRMNELLPPDARESESLARAAGTATVEPAAGPGWFAAGDTLLAADPLSSRGIVHALRSGMLAAYAAIDTIHGRGEEALRRYRAIHDHGFEAYRNSLAEHYAEGAPRWDSPFWRRRAAPGARPGRAAGELR